MATVEGGGCDVDVIDALKPKAWERLVINFGSNDLKEPTSTAFSTATPSTMPMLATNVSSKVSQRW